MTLRTWVIVIVAGLVVAGIGAVSLVAYALADRELTAETDRFLSDRADEIIAGRRASVRQGDRGDAMTLSSSSTPTRSSERSIAREPSSTAAGAHCRSETDELGLFVNEVIELARGDLDAARTDTEVDLADVVGDAVDRFCRRTDRDVMVTTESTPLLGNVGLLDRAVTNLLGNAHEFSPPDRSIEVRLADRTLSVRDHGAGIDPADLDRLFDRFYPADAARSQPGSGLGIAIVRQVAETHGGGAAAANASDGGAVVSFTVA